MIVFDRRGQLPALLGRGRVQARARPAHRSPRQPLLHRRRRPHRAPLHHRRQDRAHHRRARQARALHERRAVPPLHAHGAVAQGRDLRLRRLRQCARAQVSRPPASCIMSWGESGSEPGQFNIAHNIATDEDGWVYVADRENHRVQVFDGNGKYETQWNNLHRPCGLYCCRGKTPTFVIGELGPGMRVNLKAPNLGPAPLHRRRQGQADRAARRQGRSRGWSPASSSPRTAWRSTPRATSTSARSPTPTGPRAFPTSRCRVRCARCRSWRRSPELVQRTKKERLDGGARRPEWRARNPHGGEGRRAWAIGREDRWWRDLSRVATRWLLPREQGRAIAARTDAGMHAPQKSHECSRHIRDISLL